MSNQNEKKTPEQIAKEVQAAIDAQRKNAQNVVEAGAAKAEAVPIEPTDQEVSDAAKAAGVTPEMLHAAVEEVLNKRKARVVDSFTPKEPDWSKISEKDILTKDIYIPVIDHEIPDYMNVQLKDQEFVPVWASRDQRRLGQLLAEGYEFIRAEHLKTNWTPPLKFDSEGNYIYQDVIAMRVHKRIRFAKLRRIQEVSQSQLKSAKAQSDAKRKLAEEVIANDPALDVAFSSGKFGFYEPATK